MIFVAFSRTSFDYRIIVDRHFFNKKLKGNADMLHKLIFINTKSQDHKKNHVLMSEKIREEILKEDDNSEIFIKSALTKINEPKDIESESDEVTRNVKYAIHLLHEKPNRVMIFTSNEKEIEYLKNPHYKLDSYKDMQNILIQREDVAVAVIEEYSNKAKSNSGV